MMRSGRLAPGRGNTDQMRTSGRNAMRCGRFTAAPSRLHRGGGGRMGLSDGLGENQAVRFAIEVEDFSVAAPVHGSFELALHFILAEVFVENVVKELVGNGVISLGVQDAIDLLENHDVFERCLPKKNLAG